MPKSDALAESDFLQRATTAHYDAHPFDFMTDRDVANIASLQPKPFLQFVERYLAPGDEVAEIGCGPGRGTVFLCSKKLFVHAVDISRRSLEMARRRAPEAKYTLASNLALPFADGTFDAVVSDGVIHHTPNAFSSFSENARVLRKDGHMYLAVYKRNHYYYYVYHYLGRPARWLAQYPVGVALLHSTLLPIYYLAHLSKSGGRRTWSGARNFFWDYILTPQATFYTRSQINDWASEMNMSIIEYHPDIGTVHAFVLKKNGARKAP